MQEFFVKNNFVMGKRLLGTESLGPKISQGLRNKKKPKKRSKKHEIGVELSSKFWCSIFFKWRALLCLKKCV